jgi:hypothetical protein
MENRRNSDFCLELSFEGVSLLILHVLSFLHPPDNVMPVVQDESDCLAREITKKVFAKMGEGTLK